jgi:hypothetical protein
MESRSGGESEHGRRFVVYLVVIRLLIPFALAALVYCVPLANSAAQRLVIAIFAAAVGTVIALFVPSFWRRRPAK